MDPILTPNWDKHSWIASPAYIEYAAQRISAVLALKPTSSVLDIGCGRASITAALAKLHQFTQPIEGIDPSGAFSSEALDATACQGVGAEPLPILPMRLSQQTALAYLQAQPAATYEAVVMKQVFHLVEASQRVALLQEIHRCLTPHGSLLIMQMAPQLTVPMFAAGKALFENENLTTEAIIRLASGCPWQASIHAFKFPVKIAKNHYFDLLQQRFMSNLRALTDAEIAQGIAELKAEVKNQGPDFQFFDELDMLQLEKR